MATKKLNTIFEKTYDGSFIKVKLKDGTEVECKADCFCQADEEEGEDIPALLIITSYNTREIWTEDDIESIEE